MKDIFITAALCSLLTATPALAAPPAWEITDADSRVVLFPTIHVLPDGLDWETQALKAEIQQADEVWFEIEDATSPQAVAEIQALMGEKGLSPDMPLSKRLSEDQLATLTATLDSLGVPLAQIDPMRPWLAAVMLSMTSLVQAGFNPENGVEKELEDDYADRPRRGLESPAFQVGMLASLEGDDQVGFLMSSLDDLDSIGETLLQVAHAWSKGDVEMIETELLAEMRADYPDIFAAMFTNRNANWAEIIDAEMQGSGRDFIAVGAGHLVGPESVQSMLQARGYTVRRISLIDE